MSQPKDGTNNAPMTSEFSSGTQPADDERSTDNSAQAEVSKSKLPAKKSFAERMKTHRFLVVRGVYYIFYSIWTIVMGIGMVIAWIIAMLFI